MWFEIYIDAVGLWRWRLWQNICGKTEIIATSHQGYFDQSLCANDITQVKLTNLATPVYVV